MNIVSVGHRASRAGARFPNLDHSTAPLNHGSTLIRYSAYSRRVSQRGSCRRSKQAVAVRCASADRGDNHREVLVVGGSGRVGGSTCRWLLEFAQEEGLDIDVVIAGRSEANFDTAKRRIEAQLAAARLFEKRSSGRIWPEARISYAAVDLTEAGGLDAAVRGKDMVVHTAGPFQYKERPEVLEACIRCQVPYVDVCDETLLCKEAKKLQEQVVGAGVPAIVSAGIWPGVSALMVAEAVDRLAAEEEDAEVASAHLSFFTAGTGNAGPTIVSATFLLLAMGALTYEGGAATEREAWTQGRLVDFGPGAGPRRVWLLDNPEVYTLHEALRIPNLSSSFGTAPGAWNLLFGAMKALPKSVLANRGLMQGLSLFSEPVIRAVDAFVGATNAMRVDVAAKDGRRLTLRITHDDLEQAVGIGTAAFGMEILLGRVDPGVWFPVEMEDQRSEILRRARRTSILWDM